jgi:RHS repeat-associated protein
MGEAARLGDPIAHTSALAGFLAGAVIGIALIATVAFATFTCGFGVALLAGLAAGIGASAILGLGEAIGRMFSSPSGAINTGSPNVFINSKPAAYATASTVSCSKHNPTPLVAEGSGNVFYNSLPSARKGDAITCGAKIDAGSENTFVGGGTVRYLEVDDEVPGWLRTTVDWAFALAGLVGGLAGLARTAGGFSRAMLPCAAKFIGGFVIGEAVGRAVIGPAVERVYGGLFGHPVDVTTGRKLLLATDELDYVLPSPVPLECGRFYASNLTRVGALGPGWVLPWELRLERRGGHVWLIDAQGRESGFPLVQPGHSAFSETEQKYLACTTTGRYILYDLSETYYDFGEMEWGEADDTALLQRIEDQSGQWLTFERAHNSEHVRRIVSNAGHELRLSYLQMQGRLTDIELVHEGKRHTVVRYGYDTDGRLASVTDARGQVKRQFEYENGLMSAHTNALGFTCSYEWQDIGGHPRVVRACTSEGEQAVFSYDVEARQTRVVDELGRTAQWTYDEHFQVVECIDLDGKCYRTEYSEAGQPKVLHLPAEEGQERKVLFDYDEAGRIVGETDVLGRTTTTRYHRNSLRPEAVTRPDGSELKAEYDHIGRLLKTIDPLGREERYRYPEGSASPLPTVRVDAKGGKKTLRWNKSGQLIAYTDCSGKTSRYEYDAFGYLVATINALGQTTRIERLPTGQPSMVELPDGSQEHFEYDAAGLRVAHHDRAGHVRRWQRNARGQVVQATDAAGRQLDYRYDPQGRLIALASASGAYAFEYDSGDRLVQETRPDGVQRRLRYGAFGQALAQQDVGAAPERPERTMYFERDAAGRLLGHRTDTGSTTYTWDDGDRLLKAEKRPNEAGKALGVNASTVSFKHDKAGRLISEQGRDGIVGYEFDELDHLAALNLPNEQRIAWLSYGSGHVHQVRCGEQVIADVERDDLHREVMRTQGRLTLGLGYDALGRRTWQSAARDPHFVGPQQGQLWRTYRYSAEGELAEQDDSTRGAWRFQYDPAGQLLQRSRPDGRSGLEQFAWDAAGNLLDEVQRKSAGRVQGNRLTTWQDIRFEYDAWGNLKTKRSGARQTQHFVFDAENRLLAVRTESTGGHVVEASFEYDALGRRIARHERHRDAGGLARYERERRFVWQGLRMVQELRDSGLSNYVYSPDSPYTPMARVDALIGAAVAGAAIEQAQQSSRVYHFHTDLVGAPLEVTDEHGELAWVGEYSAWGRVKPDGEHQLDARIEQPLRFPGQYADDSTGLHYNTFRYYDPDAGRFISQDPIGLLGGENLYAYVPNPTGWTDPLGWMPWAWNPDGMGHHLIPRGKANSIGLHELGTERHTPSFFPDPYQSGMHEELHRAVKGDIGKLQGPWTGTAEELFEASSKGLDTVSHIKGDLRIPATGEVIASNVTPKQAHGKLVEWFKNKRGGGC